MDIWQYFIDYCSILTFTGWVTKLFLSSPAHSHLFPAMLLNFLPVSWGDGFIPPNTHLICGITREYSSTLPSIEQLRRNKNLLCFLLVPTNSRIPLLRRDSGQREREYYFWLQFPCHFPWRDLQQHPNRFICTNFA